MQDFLRSLIFHSELKTKQNENSEKLAWYSLKLKWHYQIKVKHVFLFSIIFLHFNAILIVAVLLETILIAVC